MPRLIYILFWRYLQSVLYPYHLDIRCSERTNERLYHSTEQTHRNAETKYYHHNGQDKQKMSVKL